MLWSDTFRLCDGAYHRVADVVNVGGSATEPPCEPNPIQQVSAGGGDVGNFGPCNADRRQRLIYAKIERNIRSYSHGKKPIGYCPTPVGDELTPTTELGP
jgi:hypothetical protein